MLLTTLRFAADMNPDMVLRLISKKKKTAKNRPAVMNLLHLGSGNFGHNPCLEKFHVNRKVAYDVTPFAPKKTG